jgi:hypothetical protein
MLAPMTFAAAALFTASLLGTAAQDPAPVSLGLRVNGAIARGLGWLRKEQKSDGSWGGRESEHPFGMTTFAAYTLVKSGVDPHDPTLYSALKNIGAAEFKTTYSAAVHLLLCEALSDDTTRVAGNARASFDFLVASQRAGVWGYPNDPLDMSNTQFALLGLRAGSKLGFAVPEKTLARCASALLAWQDGSLGFGYRSDGEPTAGMTAATLAGFAVLTDLGRGMATVESALAKKKNEIRGAETWLDERFAANKNAYGASAWTPGFHYAYLWAVERYCGLSKRAKVGAHDWYREGAEYLVADQRADGGWGRSVDDVCFALLFLRRATVTAYENLSKLYAELDREKRAESQAVHEVHPDASIPRITDWLIAGPFRDKPGAPMLAKPPFAPEKLVPREKQQLREHVFERWTLKSDGWTDLEQMTGRGDNFLLWVLATNVIYRPVASDKPSSGASKSDAAALEAVLWLALEDGWKVYFDGKLVSSDERVQAPIEETVRVDLRIEPGVHTLVVLASDDIGSSAFGARFTDPLGHALPASVLTCADPLGKPRVAEKSDKKK